MLTDTFRAPEAGRRDARASVTVWGKTNANTIFPCFIKATTPLDFFQLLSVSTDEGLSWKPSGVTQTFEKQDIRLVDGTAMLLTYTKVS